MVAKMGEWELAIGDWRLAISEWGLAIGDWRLAIRDWGLAIGDWRLAIGYGYSFSLTSLFFPDRQSLIANP